MSVIGWLRVGDKAACGAAVIEGSLCEISNGRGYTWDGAKMSCGARCIIIEGGHFPPVSLSNGRRIPIHGDRTSKGCPVISTLNGQDGRGIDQVAAGWSAPESDQEAAAVPAAFVPRGNDWQGIPEHPQAALHEMDYDEYFLLVDEKGGPPAVNRSYRLTMPSGEVIEGFSDEQGRTSLALSGNAPAPLKVEIDPPTVFQAV